MTIKQLLSTTAANGLYDQALALAAKMSDDTLSDIGEYIADREAVKRGPMMLCSDLENDYTAAVIADWPVPGSKDGEQGGNRLPDKFTKTFTVDGQTKKKPASFYSIFFDSTARGMDIAAHLAAIDAAENGNADAPTELTTRFPKEAAVIYSNYKRMLPVDRKAERAKYAQNRTDARNALTKAVKLSQHLGLVRAMEKVGVRFAMKDSGEKDREGNAVMVLRNTPKPIIIYDKTAPEMAAPVSVDTFLTYDVELAILNGGTMGDLTETAGRDGSGGAGQDNKGKGQVPTIKNPQDQEGFIAELAANLGTNQGKADLLKIGAGKEGKAFRISCCIIADVLDSPTTKWRAEYEAYLEDLSVQQSQKTGTNG